MSSTTLNRIISVVGATGHQGGGVVDLLLQSTNYHVRALSSNPSSDRAKTLLSRHAKYVDDGRFKLVEGNLNDRTSLENAIKGSYGLFASFSPSIVDEPIEKNPEVTQGKNLVDAAKAVGVEHFVYSSLPSTAKLTNGRFNVFPFEAKAIVEKYARGELKNSTFVIPGSFFSNLNNPVWAKRGADGSFIVTNPLSPETTLGWIDEHYDMGRFVTAIFEKGPAVTAGKTYPINSTPVTSSQLAEAYSKVSGEPSKFEPLSIDTFTNTIKAFAPAILADALTQMILFIDSNEPSPYAYGPGYIETDTSFEDLGVKASSPEEYFKRSGWRAPPPPSAA